MQQLIWETGMHPDTSSPNSSPHRAPLQVARGLAGVEVDDTAVSLVDGDRGNLSYRGYAIETLVHWPFSRVAKLVLDGADSDSADILSFDQAMLETEPLDAREQRLLGLAVDNTSSSHPMQILQGMVPLLSRNKLPREFERYDDAARGLVIAARFPCLVAELQRLMTSKYSNQTELPVTHQPVDGLDINRRFLTRIQGCKPSAAHLQALSICQILQLEHSFNASTFTARVVASTLAPVENCLSAALGALHGRLHGGADQAALEIADRVAEPRAAAAFVDDCLERGIKVMGMGHREYTTLDPRARFVKQLARDLSHGTPQEVTYQTLAAIEDRFNERMQQRGRTLYANLEFYKGVVYRILGLQPEFFTATFAMARMFGYLAHFIESRQNNRLMRPQARYVGSPVKSST